MPLYTTDALILRTYKLGDADRIVVFLTSDRGKRRGVARGARRTRSRFLGALEPLTRVVVAYVERERRDLVQLREVDTVRSPLAARDPDALGYVGYFAELIDEWAPEADPNERLYRLGASVVEALSQGVPVERLARYFEYWLLRLQGVYPSIVACHRCAADLRDRGALIASRQGVFICAQCGPPAAGVDLSPEALAFLRVAGTAGPDRLAALELSGRAGRELEAVHRLLISTHLEKELRSTKVTRGLGGVSTPPSGQRSARPVGVARPIVER